MQRSFGKIDKEHCGSGQGITKYYNPYHYKLTVLLQLQLLFAEVFLAILPNPIFLTVLWGEDCDGSHFSDIAIETSQGGVVTVQVPVIP